MTSGLKVGVVGVGIMGERHARVYSEMPETELVGVFDPDPVRARHVADRYESASTSVDDLLNSVQAVSIASPTSTHAEVAERALGLGLHVLVEKPLAGTLDEAAALLLAAQRHPSRVFMVGHIERFNPTILTLQSVIDGQSIRGLRFTRTSPFDKRSLDSDIVYDLMIHDIDLALELLGEEIESIDASGDAVVTERIDHAEAELRMKGGLPVEFVASRVAAAKVRAVEVRTDDATITADLLGKCITIEPDALNTSAPSVGSDEPLRLELEHFARCAIEGVQPVVGIEAGYRSMVMAATISSLIQRTITASRDRRLVSAAD